MKRFFATMASKTPKRFAPLQPGVSPSSGAPLLRGIVFDMDGTLWYWNPSSQHCFSLTVCCSACPKTTCSA